MLKKYFIVVILICHFIIFHSVSNQSIMKSVFLTSLEASRKQGLCPLIYGPLFFQCGANTGSLVNICWTIIIWSSCWQIKFWVSLSVSHHELCSASQGGKTEPTTSSFVLVKRFGFHQASDFTELSFPGLSFNANPFILREINKELALWRSARKPHIRKAPVWKDFLICCSLGHRMT